MKIKNILENLKEEFVTSSKMAGAYREVFKNPSKSEILDIENFDGVKWGNNVRFIADRDRKDVYVSSADVLHYMIIDLAGLGRVVLDKNFAGMGVSEYGKIVVTELGDSYGMAEKDKEQVINDLKDGKYDWMERYNFDLSYIKKKLK